MRPVLPAPRDAAAARRLPAVVRAALVGGLLLATPTLAGAQEPPAGRLPASEAYRRVLSERAALDGRWGDLGALQVDGRPAEAVAFRDQVWRRAAPGEAGGALPDLEAWPRLRALRADRERRETGGLAAAEQPEHPFRTLPDDDRVLEHALGLQTYAWHPAPAPDDDLAHERRRHATALGWGALGGLLALGLLLGGLLGRRLC